MTPNSLFLFHALRGGVLIGLLPLEGSLAVASILHSDRQHKFAGSRAAADAVPALVQLPMNRQHFHGAKSSTNIQERRSDYEGVFYSVQYPCSQTKIARGWVVSV
jgi:hypothetical protein